MEFLENECYHIYNRGNNKQRIFFRKSNYRFFIKKIKKHIVPYCDIISFNLMPNHFHFMIHANENSVKTKLAGRNRQRRNVLSEGFRILLSSYAQAINKQNGRTGSLFQQNTKSKYVSHIDSIHANTCFHYIHQNPYRARMINKLEDWEFSSFNDYCDVKRKTFVNRELGVKLLGLELESFYEDSYRMLYEYAIQKNY
jgi:putative transposase